MALTAKKHFPAKQVRDFSHFTPKKEPSVVFYDWGNALISFSAFGTSFLLANYGMELHQANLFLFSYTIGFGILGLSAGIKISSRLKKRKSFTFVISQFLSTLLSSISIPLLYSSFALVLPVPALLYSLVTVIMFFCGVSLSMMAQLLPSDPSHAQKLNYVWGALIASGLSLPLLHFTEVSFFRVGSFLALPSAIFTMGISWAHRRGFKSHQNQWLIAIGAVTTLLIFHFLFADKFKSYLEFKFFQIKPL